MVCTSDIFIFYWPQTKAENSRWYGFNFIVTILILWYDAEELCYLQIIFAPTVGFHYPFNTCKYNVQLYETRSLVNDYVFIVIDIIYLSTITLPAEYILRSKTKEKYNHFVFEFKGFEIGNKMIKTVHICLLTTNNMQLTDFQQNRALCIIVLY